MWLSLKDENTVPPQMPGDVLAHVQFHHEHVFMVRNLSLEQLHQACPTDAGIPPQTRQPDLEDILLAMLREYRRPQAKPATRLTV